MPSAQDLDSLYVTPERIQENKRLQAVESAVEVEIIEDADFDVMDEEFEILDEEDDMAEHAGQIEMDSLLSPSAQTMKAATSVDALAEEASSMFELMSRQATIDRREPMRPEADPAAPEGDLASTEARQVGRVVMPDLHGQDVGSHLNDVGVLQIPAQFQ